MEITANSVQTVLSDQNVLFTDTTICGNCSIIHRSGSGLITMKGNTSQGRARYRATFNANIAIPTGGTVGQISLALAIAGEIIPVTTMIVTPAAVDEYFNVSTTTFIDAMRDCCVTLSVKNTSEQSIEVQNANLVIERVA